MKLNCSEATDALPARRQRLRSSRKTGRRAVTPAASDDFRSFESAAAPQTKSGLSLERTTNPRLEKFAHNRSARLAKHIPALCFSERYPLAIGPLPCPTKSD